MQFRRRRLIPGLILILLGIAFLLMQYYEFGPGVILVFMGLAFLIPYVLTRQYPALIPGCILTGIGIGLLYERGSRADVALPLGLGLGFIAIFIIDFAVTRMVRWWPLVPGLVLALIGVVGNFPEVRIWLRTGWPILLIGAGLLLLALEFLRGRSEVNRAA